MYVQEFSVAKPSTAEAPQTDIIRELSSDIAKKRRQRSEPLRLFLLRKSGHASSGQSSQHHRGAKALAAGCFGPPLHPLNLEKSSRTRF